MSDNTTPGMATTITIVRRPPRGGASTDATAATAASAPKQAPAKAKDRPVKKTPVIETKPAPTGGLKDIIAAAEQAINPQDLKDFAVLAVHFKARSDVDARGLATTIRELIAKARDGASGPSAEYTAAAETVAALAQALETADNQIAQAPQDVVGAANELLKLRVAKAELEQREKAVKSDRARFAGLSGRAAKASGDAKTTLEGQRDLLGAAIANETAAIAEQRALLGDKLATCDEDFAKHQAETPRFDEIVALFAERDRLAADYALASTAHEKLAADGPGLADLLAKMVTAYNNRIAELSRTK